MFGQRNCLDSEFSAGKRRIGALHGASLGLLFGFAFLLYFRNFGYDSPDDLFFSHAEDGTYLLGLAQLGNGRYIPAGVLLLLSAYGLEFFRYKFILAVSGYLALAAFSYVFVSVLRPHAGHFDKMVCAGIILAFPYNTAALLHSNYLLNAFFMFGTLACAMILYASDSTLRRTLGCGLCLLAAIAANQVALNYFIAFICAYHLFHGDNAAATAKRFLTGLVVGGVTALAYLIAFNLAVDPIHGAISNAGNGTLTELFAKSRSGFKDITQLPNAILDHLWLVFRVVFIPEPIFHVGLKAISVAALLIAFVHWQPSANSGEAAQPANRFLRIRMIVFSIFLLLLLGSPIQVFLKYNYLTPRIQMHSAVIWAALFLAALTVAPPLRRPIVVALAVMYLAGTALSTILINEQKFALYQKDLQLAKRIFANLNGKASFDPHKPIAVVGHIGPDSPYMAGTSNYYRIIDTKFAFGWAQLETLEEATGKEFTGATQNFCRAATRYCDAHMDRSRTLTTSVSERGSTICLPNRGGEWRSYCQMPIR